MKPKITILSDDENGIQVTVSKNGRPVSEATMKAVLAKRFPDVEFTEFTSGSKARGARSKLTKVAEVNSGNRDILQALVDRGCILNFRCEFVNEYGEVVDGKSVKESMFRNTERLTLTFPDHTIMTLETQCSGTSENTSLSVSLDA